MEKAVGHRIFLLSPAYAGGERARMILRDQAQFPLARKLRAKSGAPIADVFTFLSGLYFRGKFALMICVNLRRSTSIRTIRVTECQSSATRGIWPRNCRPKAKCFFL